MSFKKWIAAVAVAVVANVTSAQASFLALGSTFDGQTGSLTETGQGGNNTFISGILAANTQINFVYTLDDVNNAGVSELAGYNYWDSGHHYKGFAFLNMTGHLTTQDKVDGVDGPNLVLATANLTSTGGTSAIVNSSGGPVEFVVRLFGIFSKSSSALISYSVSSLSSVPLPAMAPLFGIAVAGLGLAGRRRKAAKAHA